MYKDYLLEAGVLENHMILIELDSDIFESQRNKHHLRTYIESKIVDDKMHYLFIDEIQLCEGFESLLNGLNRKSNIDIYVTGSNSRFLATDVITEFRGRGDFVSFDRDIREQSIVVDGKLWFNTRSK